VRAIERRLESRPPEGCTVRTPSGQLDLDANENYPALIEAQADLLASAFACDRTRVASLQWSRSFSMVRHTWLGSNEGHHTLSHDVNERPVLSAITRWYNERLAGLLDRLKALPEGEGSVLDNTLVVYCNELHTGWDHKPGPVPTISPRSRGPLPRGERVAGLLLRSGSQRHDCGSHLWHCLLAPVVAAVRTRSELVLPRGGRCRA